MGGLKTAHIKNPKNATFIKRASHSAKKSKTKNCFKNTEQSPNPQNKIREIDIQIQKKVEAPDLDKIQRLHSQIKSDLLFENKFDRSSAILFVQKFRELLSKSTAEPNRSVKGGRAKRVKRF